MHRKKISNQQSKTDTDSSAYFKSKINHFETSWGIRPGVGTGVLKEFRFKSGIAVYLHDYRTVKSLTSHNTDTSAFFGFRFCLSGHTKLNLECFKTPLDVKSGDSGFFYSPNMVHSHEDMPKTHIHKVLVLVDPLVFLSLMQEEMQTVPFKPAVSAGSGTALYEPYRVEGIITPSMRIILQQLFTCPYEGSARRIFIEGKAMELMACKLDQIRLAGNKRQLKASIRPGDVDRFHFAGELLSKSLSSPPNVMELARTIGVSRTKLYHGFNQLFGVSPMEYLRIKRIEKAKLMVKNKDLSMTQIAYTLGYSSSSHFAKAFRDFFGMPPSHYRHKENA